MYKVKKADHKITDMTDAAWNMAEVAEVSLDNWGVNEYTPKMTARILYSDYGLHIMMQTDEDNLVARERRQNGDIYLDSCMEFFFSGNETNPTYFNFEFNPFGNLYISTRKSRLDFYFPEGDKRYFEVVSDVAPGLWTIMFTVPFEFIDKEHGAHTKRFKGNFFKCGGTRKHYLTYYPVGTAAPDFHRPEYFGDFELE